MRRPIIEPVFGSSAHPREVIMSARHLRIVLASTIVVFAASACTAATGPSDTANLDATETAPLEEHQGSDSIRATDMVPMHTEHQGSDS